MRRKCFGTCNVLNLGDVTHDLFCSQIDYRDCFEKRELVERLKERRQQLPGFVQNRLSVSRNGPMQRLCFPADRNSVVQAMLSRLSPATTPGEAAMASTQLTDTEADMLASGLFLDEQNTIALFKRCSPSVVHVHNLAMGLNPLTMNLSEIPRGAGSGFLWDREGHIVTNFHVVQVSRCIPAGFQ